MLWFVLIVFPLAVLGHVCSCLYASNFLNSLGLHRTLKRLLSMPLEGLLVAAPVTVVAWTWAGGLNWGAPATWGPAQAVVFGYGVLAAGVAVGFLPGWLYRAVTARPPALLLSNHTTTLDLAPQLKGRIVNRGLGRLFLKIPGNQSLHVAIHEKTIRAPRLPSTLDGFTITQLSDLHFTGRIGKAYFEEVVRLANELDSDLIAITGDLVDSPACIDWLPDTLGRLRARDGVYFVLGNHDLRCDAARIRQVLTSCGLIDLSGRWVRREIHGQSVLLAGNELPWIKPAADLGNCPPGEDGERDFRILLSHSPDQHLWAIEREIDLMLAGHTHGGQIRFPLIGPILAPSRYGVRYAAGTFHLPPTVMHVTRGLSGLQPIRLNCPPELTKLVLRHPGSTS